MKNNFQCTACFKPFFVAEYTEIIRTPPAYKDKANRALYCPFCEKSNSIVYIGHKKGVPELLGAFNGTFPSEDKLRKDKQAQRKERSRHHFKNTELPNINNPVDKAKYTLRYKKTKFKDHEKM